MLQSFCNFKWYENQIQRYLLTHQFYQDKYQRHSRDWEHSPIYSKHFFYIQVNVKYVIYYNHIQIQVCFLSCVGELKFHFHKYSSKAKKIKLITLTRMINICFGVGGHSRHRDSPNLFGEQESLTNHLSPQNLWLATVIELISSRIQ